MARRKTDGDLESFVRGICKQAINEYVEIVWNTANDIYNSCIKQYYASYTPTVYKRHNHPEGKNLYQANGFTLNGMSFNDLDANGMSIETLLQSSEEMILDDFNGGQSENLWKYGSKRDIREEVLAAVLSGQRGITVRPSPPAKFKWPRGWVTSYPNKYSQYHYWSSSASTIEEIIADFEANIINDTSDLLDKLIDKQFK